MIKLSDKILIPLKIFISDLFWVLIGYPKKKSGVPTGLAPKSFLKKINPSTKVSFSQQGEDLVLDRVLSRVVGLNLYEKGYYIDVGCFHAIKDSVTYLLYLRGWSGIVIDPSTLAKKSFNKYRKRDIFYKCIIGQKDSIYRNFFINKNAIADSHTGNTLYPKVKENFYKRQVFQRNLNDLLNENNITNIDFLNIDVEGAELEIIKKFNFKKFKPKVVAIEVHTEDIQNILESEIYKILFNSSYICVASTVITWFFVRRELRLPVK